MRLLVIGLLLMTLPVSAEQLFVRNQPFRGQVVGTGANLLAELEPLLAAVNLTLPEGLEVVERNGVRLVNLHDFARRAGLRLVPNPQLQTVDLVLPRPRIDWVLLHFTASWCGPCRQLQPTLQRVAQELELSIHTVDLDKDTPDRARYGVFFEGRRLPFLVLLDPAGRPVGRWSGSPTYALLRAELSRAKNRQAGPVPDLSK